MIVSFFTGFIKSHGLAAAIISALIVLCAIFSAQKLEIAHDEKQIQEQKAVNIALENSNQLLVNALKQQNDAVIAMQREANLRRIKAQKALQAVNGQMLMYQSNAQRIEAQKLSGNECDELKSLIKSYAVSHHKNAQ